MLLYIESFSTAKNWVWYFRHLILSMWNQSKKTSLISSISPARCAAVIAKCFVHHIHSVDDLNKERETIQSSSQRNSLPYAESSLPSKIRVGQFCSISYLSHLSFYEKKTALRAEEIKTYKVSSHTGIDHLEITEI